MYLRLVKLVSMFLISIVALSGCGKGNIIDSQSSVNSNVKRFTIVTSFYPIYISTINITKDIPNVEVINMTKPQTGCLHDYQLTPGDLKTLEKANVFIINGAGMESFMDKVVEQRKDLKIIESSKGIDIIKDENGEENPHVWVSVSDAMLQVKNITEQLVGFDKVNEAEYRKNADKYYEKLQALKDKMHEKIDKLNNKDIITFHEAFPYFAKEFGLNIAAVIEREPGTSPSPKEIESTINIIKESKIKAVFAEPQYPAKTAQTIAKESGAKIYTLDPVVTGDAKPDAIDDYIIKMEQNLESLLEALK